MKTLNRIALIIAIMLVNFVLYIAIGLVIMSYEDFYDKSKGPYWSLRSMTAIQKIAYISYYVLIILNIVLVIYVALRLIKNRFLLSQE